MANVNETTPKTTEPKAIGKKPMRPITQLITSIAIIAVVVVATLFLFRYPQKLGPIFITALVVTLASFLVVLILRHFVLVWFSYLHARELAHDEIPENYPFLSIVVPAFNEAEVIGASLSSLLELDYPHFESIWPVSRNSLRPDTKKVWMQSSWPSKPTKRS